MPVHVRIDAETLEDAISMANETYEHFKDREGYYQNTRENHLVGKLGELACAHWAASLDLACDQASRDTKRMNEADLILMLGDGRRLYVEVKTWSSHLWQPFGRCIRVGQMLDVCDKADIVLWCTVTPLLDVLQGNECNVQVEGWNTPTEIAEVPPILTGPTGRQYCNHQVPTKQVRPLDQLAVWLRGEA